MLNLRSIQWVLVLSLVFALAQNIEAQVLYGTLTGTVTDASGGSGSDDRSSPKLTRLREKSFESRNWQAEPPAPPHQIKLLQSAGTGRFRSEEHTSELQSRQYLRSPLL